jgi:hypothetical protein
MDFCPYFLHLNPSPGILPAQVRTFVVYLLSGVLLVAPNLPLSKQNQSRISRLLHLYLINTSDSSETSRCPCTATQRAGGTYKYIELP